MYPRSWDLLDFKLVVDIELLLLAYNSSGDLESKLDFKLLQGRLKIMKPSILIQSDFDIAIELIVTWL